MEDFVDVSKERNSNVWNFFLWNRRDEKAKCKTCDAVFKCKRSSTKSLFETPTLVEIGTTLVKN